MAAENRAMLTDRKLQAIKPAPKGKREMHWDARQPYLALRVTEHGTKTWIVYKRTAGKLVGVVIGKYPSVPLAKARERAGEILDTLAEGKHPREVEREREREEAARRQEEARRQRDTFASAVETFVKAVKADGVRTGAATEAVLRREFLGQTLKRVKKSFERDSKTVEEWVREWNPGTDFLWSARPVAEIRKRDVVERLDTIKAARGPHAARGALAAIRKFFNWCADGERYGIEVSPCAGMSDKKTLRIKRHQLMRQHVLTDADLNDVWKSADGFGYPFGAVVKLLLLTGQRRSDIAEARKPELDLEARLLRIPPERYKTNSAHEVPLTPLAVEIFKGLPSFTGSYVFTTTGGRRPISGISKYSDRLHKAIAKRREAEGREPMEHFRLHDLRRTVRTRLADLGVEDFIAERVIGHAMPGLHQIYNQSSHADKKRAALEAWETKLKIIVGLTPKPDGSVVTADELARRRKRGRGRA